MQLLSGCHSYLMTDLFVFVYLEQPYTVHVDLAEGMILHNLGSGKIILHVEEAPVIGIGRRDSKTSNLSARSEMPS